MVLGKLDHSLIPHTKINSNWFKDLKVRPETISFLEENSGKPLTYILLKIFWIQHQKQQDHTKLKSCTAKDTINKMKRQPTEWKKICASHISGKGGISTIYKEFIKFKSKTTTQLKTEQRIGIDISPGRHTDGQHGHEKKNIVNHQGNANQNHHELSPHTCQNGYYQKDKK